MDVKPGGFFLGLTDFLAMLVPGAVLALALTPYADPIFGAGRLFPLISDTVTRWGVFIIVAYVTGHLVAFVASSVLDPLYDRTYRNFHRLPNHRKVTIPKNLLLAWCSSIIDFRTKLIAAWRLPDEEASDLLLAAARALKARQIAQLALGANFKDLANQNMLMWAQSDVTIRSSPAAAEIEKYQANSKFFRSMTIVLFVLAGLIIFREIPSWALVGRLFLIFMLLMLFCYRFMQLRWEGTKRTYEYFLLSTLRREALTDGSPKSTEC